MRRSPSIAPQDAAGFLVRQGSTGWMVYDRERTGPAVIGIDLAANLTKEQAETSATRVDVTGRRPS